MNRLLGAGALLLTAVAAAGCSSAAAPGPAAAPASAAAPVSAPAAAMGHPEETLTPLLAQALPNVAGKTFTSAIVTFPPSAGAAPHRHGDAFVYAYVLEGTVRSRLEGEPARTYHQGENWTEQPGAHHVATDNVSATEPAKLLVVFVATTGEQLKVDDPHG
ncbi:cupin domain-containing protein [Amycolatopsis rhabdoformis]|uniref:Cupin domain-containing protein n=1 Tax=Amycolatopsis rhabdoformis TaxID=1448059 RepID=A0ABZ1IC55_9PSEU|nr:cupin domain-containing protein [Amycolatopsis rhabdoformis]WSE32056.1 cupin domain-containing protein [Amycolatopsis rhabdoformis]